MSDAEWVERTRARILRDVDPAVVEAGRLSRLAFAERIGNPRRCGGTNECHPADGSCLYCGAWNGETCRDPVDAQKSTAKPPVA